MTMSEVDLEGCKAAPLAQYLKALGVFRLLSHSFSDVRAYWRHEHLVLRTTLTRKDIENFFLYTYKPTPIISPWNGRAGFLEGDDTEEPQRKGPKILGAVKQGKGQRFSPYKAVLSAVDNVATIKDLNRERAESKRLEDLKRAKKLDDEGLKRLSATKAKVTRLKNELLIAIRAELDDLMLPWIDACFALCNGAGTPSPMLGSGGNEGSMDFSINHLGYLLMLIDVNNDQPTELAQALLPNALFGDICLRGVSSNMGFFDGFATGGVNMAAGFVGKPIGNIWDSVLAMEGSLVFASASTRRLEITASGYPSFPFAVSASLAGSGTLAANEKARQELWLPTWKKPATITETITLFAEGRVTKGRLNAISGLDMLEALSSLGIDRGIDAFYRFGLYERRGEGYYVSSCLGRFKAPVTRLNNWILKSLNQNGWIDIFRHFASHSNTPQRFQVLRKRLEDALFDLSARIPNSAEAQALLILLGQIQEALGCCSKAMGEVPPVPRLSERWVTAADDGTPAFRIARALAGLRGVEEVPMPLRAHLYPISPRGNRWVTPDAQQHVRFYCGHKKRLPDQLIDILQTRLRLTKALNLADKPLTGAAGAGLGDVSAFLRTSQMDERIQALMAGLSLCEIPSGDSPSAGEGTVPAAFALLKLALTPDRILRRLGWLNDQEHVPIPTGMIEQLAGGNHGNRAVQTAWRRLHASGLTLVIPLRDLPLLAGIDPRRAAAALTIPLRYGAIAQCARQIFQPSQIHSDVL
jgi:CRISPR-associated protein Csx17